MSEATQAQAGGAERDHILDALATFAAQRPGLEYGNYASGYGDESGRRAYFSEMRSITRDLHDARELLGAVRWRTGIDVAALREAFRAFSGRLACTITPSGGAALDYCTGQYFPTEYRKAVCAVLAHALWYYWRADAIEAQARAPKCDAFPDAAEHPYNCGHCNGTGHEGPSIGDRIQRTARAELSRGVARRWFR